MHSWDRAISVLGLFPSTWKIRALGSTWEKRLSVCSSVCYSRNFKIVYICTFCSTKIHIYWVFTCYFLPSQHLHHHELHVSLCCQELQQDLMIVMQFHLTWMCSSSSTKYSLYDRMADTLIFWHIKDFVLTAVECCAVDNPFIAVCMCMCTSSGVSISLVYLFQSLVTCCFASIIQSSL